MSHRIPCPGCGKQQQVASTTDLPDFPFCSVRCREGDAGRWILGAYQIVEETGADPAMQPSLSDLADGDL